MSSSDFALIEMLFAFGVVLALALWQLWDVRPSKDRKPSDEDGDEKS